jgi:hypothetical protein
MEGRDKSKLLEKIPDIINIASMALFIDKHSKSSAEKAKKLIYTYSMTPKLTQAVVDWINLGIALLSNDPIDIKNVEYIHKALLSLNEYLIKEPGKKPSDDKLLEEIFMCIIGL